MADRQYFNLKIYLYLLIIFVSFAYVSADIPDTLNAYTVNYFDFDDDNLNGAGTRIYDILGTGEYFTNYGGTFGVDGVLYESWQDNGSVYLESDIDRSFETSATFNYWVYFEDSTPLNESYTIAKDGAGAGGGFYYQRLNQNGSFYSRLRGNGVSCELVTPTGYISDKTWHMITTTRSNAGVNMSVFIDGVFIKNVTSCSNTEIGTEAIHEVFLGRYTSDSYWLTGKLDELAYFNKTLNSSEIAYLYNSGLPASLQQYPYLPISIDLIYPTNNTIDRTYNGSIRLNMSNIDDNFNVTCYINDSIWRTVGNNNGTSFVNLLNYTLITTYNSSLYINCTNSKRSTGLYVNVVYGNQYNFSFYDESTNTIMVGDNVTVELFTHYNYIDDSTITGLLTLNDTIDGSYTLIYTSDGYTTRTEEFVIRGGGSGTYTYYLLNSTSVDDITCYVYDTVGNKLEGYDIQILKLIDGSYILVETATTNFNGEAVISAEKNTPFYKFYILYNGIILKTTAQTEIITDTLTFYVDLFSDIYSSYDKARRLVYDFDYDIASENFVVDYVDTTLTVSEVCLEVYSTTSVTVARSLYNSSCLTTTSGTIYVGAPNISGTTYYGELYTSFSPEQYLDQLIQQFPDSVLDLGILGMFLTLLIIMSFGLIGIWYPPIGVILVAFGFWATKLLHLHNLSNSVVSVITAICIIMAFVLGSKVGVRSGV